MSTPSADGIASGAPLVIQGVVIIHYEDGTYGSILPRYCYHSRCRRQFQSWQKKGHRENIALCLCRYDSTVRKRTNEYNGGKEYHGAFRRVCQSRCQHDVTERNKTGQR